MSRLWPALFALAVIAVGCGGGSDSSSSSLSDDQAEQVKVALGSIDTACSSGRSFATGADDISESIDTLLDVFGAAPDATYTEPGTSKSQSMQNVMTEAEDTLQMNCPLDLVKPDEVNALTDAVNAHATGD